MFGGPDVKRSSVMMWDANYDYVRLTARGGSEDDAAAILYRQAARACVARALGGECSLRPWAWQGYRGASGPGAAYGTRWDGHIFQASGYAAHDARGLGLLWDNVPRVDVALTVWYEQDECASIAHHAKVSRRFSASKGVSGWKVTHIDGGEHGTTTYVGSRTSDIFIRIYDKDRESEGDEDYENAIRYEVEFKGEAAKEVWAAAHRTTPSREYLASLVQNVCTPRGVHLPLLAPASLAQAPVIKPPKTDTERRLAWLRNQVAPSIDKLLTDGVHRDTILAELGLSPSEAERISTKLRLSREGGSSDA